MYPKDTGVLVKDFAQSLGLNKKSKKYVTICKFLFYLCKK